MTLIDVKVEVYNYLIKDCSIIHEDIDLYKEYVAIIIDEFIKLDVLREVTSERGALKEFHKYYILTKPIQSYSQKVEINGGLASDISVLLGKFAQRLNDNSIKPNPLALTENDIKILASFAFQYWKELEAIDPE